MTRGWMDKGITMSKCSTKCCAGRLSWVAGALPCSFPWQREAAFGQCLSWAFPAPVLL